MAFHRQRRRPGRQAGRLDQDDGYPEGICRTVEATVAAAFSVPVRRLRAPRRCRAQIAFARQSAMYLAHVVGGLSYTEVGRAFGRDRTTAAHACRVIEERREDPALDAAFLTLEEIVGLVRRRPLERRCRP
jgi:chromosomal replication initiation ATPase DnaA